MIQKESYNLTTELEIYKAMFEALPQSMFLMDRDKIIIGIYNASPESLAGFTVDQIIGNSILLYANDPESPLYQACSMLNSTFDPVFKTGKPIKLQYMILDTYFEATITKISGDRILCQVGEITDIILKQREIEQRKHNEVHMAMIAGGLSSWSYNVQSKIVSSEEKNSVIYHDMPLDELLSQTQESDRQVVIDMFDNIALHGEKHAQITVQVYNEQGRLQWSDVHAIPHEYDEQGNVVEIIGSQKDITEEYEHKKQLRKILKQNELILNNTNSGFVYMNPDLTVEWENVSTMFHDSGIECMFEGGRLCGGTCEFGEECIHHTVCTALSTKDQYIGKFTTTKGLVVETIAKPVVGDNGLIEGVVLRIDDITEKEQAMHELAAAKEMAEQSDKLKSAFLANMSHEIRTPLNSIVGFAQLIPDADTPEEQQNYIDVVKSNSEVLLNLINDILDLSKIEAGYFSCNDSIFNLSELFGELEMIFRHKMRPGIELRCEVPQKTLYVNLDRMRITQVISNFMTNSIKFTKQGYIKLGYKVEGSSVRMFVEDTGIGMTEDQTQRVFNRFEKFNMFEQGTGLGTAIAKAIVDAYRGGIEVQSVEGQGSTFSAILPFNIPQRSDDPTNGQGGLDGNSDDQIQTREKSDIKLLVAEDNDSNYLLIKALLKEYGLTRAVNGLEAVELVRKEKFDIILMDMRMPVMNGLEATEHIRMFNKEIPIIAVTANAFDEDCRAAMAAGMNDFQTKPLNKAKLLETISKYI